MCALSKRDKLTPHCSFLKDYFCVCVEPIYVQLLTVVVLVIITIFLLGNLPLLLHKSLKVSLMVPMAILKMLSRSCNIEAKPKKNLTKYTEKYCHFMAKINIEYMYARKVILI